MLFIPGIGIGLGSSSISTAPTSFVADEMVKLELDLQLSIKNRPLSIDISRKMLCFSCRPLLQLVALMDKKFRHFLFYARIG